MDEFETILAEYKAAYKWLLSLIQDPTGAIETQDLSREERIEAYTRRFGRMEAFLATIGDPQKAFKSVHVAGTSGKGSVTVMIAALLTACGQRTADHTSPFLQLPAEKLRVDGQMIAPSEFATLINEIRPPVEAWRRENRLRYGQVWAALTYLFFKNSKVDWGVYETSVGGRFANSRLLPADISVITNVDYDHVKTLGPTLAGIAWHKAGVIRPNKPAVTAETKPHILEVLQKEADEQNAELIQVDYDIADDGSLTVRTVLGEFAGIRPKFKGRYQLINAATAITTVAILAQKHGFPLAKATIEQGLNAVRYPGRFEVMQEKPMVIIDGAHNPAKMRAFVSSVQQAFPNKKATVIIGKLATKDGSEMLAALAPIAERFVASQPKVYGKMPTPAETVAETLRKVAPDVEVVIRPKIETAVPETLAELSADDLLIITGSIYLIGAAREYWFDSAETLRSLEMQKQQESA